MTFNDICDLLKTGHKKFDLFLSEQYIPNTRLDEIIIGQYSFKDIYSDFKFAIREYSIVHSKVIEEWESPSWRKLFRANGFTSKDFILLVRKTNDILRSHTDEDFSLQTRRKIIESQILQFTSKNPWEDDEPIKYKMFKRLPENYDFEHQKYIYIDDILTVLREAELHQINNDTYPAVSKVFNLFQEMEIYFIETKYLEKRKYLKSDKVTDKKKTLQKYINQIRNDTDNYDEEDTLFRIRWFLFYLIYDKHKTHIFIIHSILGYKYDGAVKLYQKLFLKDHTTGKDNDFLHHTDILNLQYYHLDNENYNIFETVLHFLDLQE